TRTWPASGARPLPTGSWPAWIGSSSISITPPRRRTPRREQSTHWSRAWPLSGPARRPEGRRWRRRRGPPEGWLAWARGGAGPPRLDPAPCPGVARGRVPRLVGPQRDDIQVGGRRRADADARASGQAHRQAGRQAGRGLVEGLAGGAWRAQRQAEPAVHTHHA